jgi:hypothetical protein
MLIEGTTSLIEGGRIMLKNEKPMMPNIFNPSTKPVDIYVVKYSHLTPSN